MITQILEDWFEDSKIKEENRVNYVVLCDYFKVEKTFKCKHFKKLKSKFEKEVKELSKP